MLVNIKHFTDKKFVIPTGASEVRMSEMEESL